MARRSQQRLILLVSTAVTVGSLAAIGYALAPVLLGSSEVQVAVKKPLPPTPKTVPKKPPKKIDKPAMPIKAQTAETKEPAIKPPEKKEEPAASGDQSPSVIKSAEASVHKTEKQRPPSDKPVESKPQPAASLQKNEKAVAGPKEEEKPKRPYEEPLPGDIYEPPDIKTPTRKPKAPKARRIKKTPQEKSVKVARLTPLKRSQLPPWRRYAVWAPIKKKDRGKPKIVIVIDDMGIDQRRSKKIVALTGPLTLSYLTYAKSLYKQTRAARKAGHEIMLHLAMEPANMQNDPGPRVLLRDLEPDEIQRRLVWGLSRLHRYVGINNHMGSKFTADRYGMTIVMKELRRRGLLFLDSRTTNKSVGAVIAHAIGVPYAERNIFLDNVNELGAVQNRLAELEGLARRRGKAIAIGHPRNATIKALTAWLGEVKSRGFVIVPLTSVVHVPKIAG
ncbi:MAG: divergent polysaccharide deacetylase family protein [Rhodospirillaceae bacterium]|jgi:polysaccharide deacetylase 2 family uncharacterized protein YibQ